MVASLAYLLIQNSNKLKNINKRAIRKAKVVEEKKRGAIVNFGGKQWTFIKQQEFKNFNFKPKKGDFIQVAVTRKKNPFVDPFSVVSFENAKFILN
ncbi:hypothetical protein E5P55_01165 [Candidatus Pinguicoccus supinus]|uniref:Uncharacterized protein n=1 Tax=Candidatus Pinguicoccus supinus TaxID=2529394 RepID=A0A7T0FYD4_9BACT|nr:hypothetical protein E5P55_01165 [Candidatus Pinguicoccus supinus]